MSDPDDPPAPAVPGVPGLADVVRIAANTAGTIILAPTGFLSVRVFFHRQPIQGLTLRFGVIPTGNILSANLRTDANGIASHPQPVPLGVYICHIDFQNFVLVPAVPAINQPYTVVLPANQRAPMDVGADREVLDIGET